MVSITSPRMIPQSSSRRSPPKVSITSPSSPPKGLRIPKTSPTRTGPLTAPGHTALASHSRAYNESHRPRRTDSLAHARPIVQALDLPEPSHRRAVSAGNGLAGGENNPAVAPPVNRSSKPRTASRDVFFQEAQTALVTKDRKVSPFNTPPDSDDSSPDDTPSETMAPPPLPLHSKPTLPPSNMPASRSFAPAPTHHTIAGRRREDLASSDRSQPSSPSRSPMIKSQSLQSDGVNELVPALPPRRQDASQPATSKSSALQLGFSTKPQASNRSLDARSQNTSGSSTPKIRSRTPPVAAIMDGRRSPQRPQLSSQRPVQNVVPGADRTSTTNSISIPPASSLSEYPDSSRANRRPPLYRDTARSIHVGYDTKLFAVCGDLVCATGTVTRVWNISTGKLIMSLPHGEHVRATALCFKPARNVEEDGAKIWLGTNWGDVMEVDIVSKRITTSNAEAHHQRQVTKLHRHGIEVWSMDEDGRLCVWPANETGTPNLSSFVANGRVPRRATTSTVVGDDLWLTFGRDIRVIKPTKEQEITGQQSTPQKATQQAVTDITSATSMSEQPDKVYFGHADGRVSIYSSKDCRCLEAGSVSTYKINHLIGIGAYLWFGQSTGMMLVYDTSTDPWTVKKDWPAHEAHVAGLASDHDSLWKLNRLPAVSLGSSELRIWDGLLEDDWLGTVSEGSIHQMTADTILEDDMVEREAAFCSFRDISSLVLTWNVGATKPTDLRYDQEDSDFFRELLQANADADILVFGLQELVDLEDKKLTASMPE